MSVCTGMAGTHVANGIHVEMSAKASIFLYVNVLKFFSLINWVQLQYTLRREIAFYKIPKEFSKYERSMQLPYFLRGRHEGMCSIQ